MAREDRRDEHGARGVSDSRDLAPSDLMDWADERPSSRCQCGGDMPGRCPGPSLCPMCQTDDEDAA